MINNIFDSRRTSPFNHLDLYRILLLVAIGLIPVFYRLHSVGKDFRVNSWIIYGYLLFPTGLFAASYLSRFARRQFRFLWRSFIYSLVVWISVVAAMTRFGSQIGTSLLLVFALAITGYNIGLERLKPLYFFLAFSFLVATLAICFFVGPTVNRAILLANVFALELVTLIMSSWRIRMQVQKEERTSCLQGLFKNAPLGIVIKDMKDGTLVCNPAFEEMLGYSPEELKRMPASAYTHPDDVHRSEDLFSEFESGKRESYSLVKRYLRKDGTIVWAHLRAFRIRDMHQVPSMRIGVVEDITAREHARRSLEEQKRRYQALFEAHPAGIFVLENETITEVNRGASVLWGYEHDKLLGRTLYELSARLQPDGQLSREKITRKIEAACTEGVQRFEWRCEGKDGSIFDVKMVLDCVKTEDTHLIQVITNDISERKQRIQELQERNRELEALLEANRHLRLQRSVDRLFHKIIDIVLQILASADTASLWLQDAGREHCTVYYKERGDDTVTSKTMEIREGTFVNYIITEQRSIVFNDFYDRSERFVNAPLGKSKTLLGVPILEDDESVGALVATGLRAYHTFAERDVRLLNAVSGQVAVVVQNMNLVEQVKEMSSRLLQAEENERRRIARELHDEIGGLLTSLKLNLERGGRKDEAAIDLVESLLSRVRRLTLDLRPSVLDDLGLVPALTEYIERFSQQTKIDVDFQSDVESHMRFDSLVETASYRIVQEALTNVARHARTDHARVILRHEAKYLTVEIVDQGAGFDPADVLYRQESSGLSGMRERIELLGGSLKVDATPGAGTHITATLNLSV